MLRSLKLSQNFLRYDEGDLAALNGFFFLQKMSDVRATDPDR